MNLIEPLKKEHIEQLRVIRNKKEVWNNFSNAFLINELEQINWFESQSTDATKQYFAILIKNKVIGSVWYDEWDKINRSIRIGIMIDPDYQQKGIGLRVLEEFIVYLFNDLNLHKVWLLVLENNIKAIGLYEKLKFIEEGRQKEAVFRNGIYLDYIMMSKLKS